VFDPKSWRLLGLKSKCLEIAGFEIILLKMSMFGLFQPNETALYCFYYLLWNINTLLINKLY
jgi:hypothetical protein